MALMMRMRYLDRPTQVARDRRWAKAEPTTAQRSEGLFYQLPEKMQESLVEAARRQRVSAGKESDARRPRRAAAVSGAEARGECREAAAQDCRSVRPRPGALSSVASVDHQ